MSFSREIYEYGLPHRAVSVYMYLSNRAGKRKECFPSVKTIAADLKISKSTEREERRRTSGGRSSTLYRVKG